MIPNTTTRTWCVLTVALALVVLVGLLTTARQMHISPAEAASGPSPAGGGIERYSVFDRADLATPGAALYDDREGPSARSLGIDPQLTRLTQASGRRRVYLQAGNDVICIAVDFGDHGATRCASRNAALDQVDLGAGVIAENDSYFVTAIVPDGTRAIQLEDQSGRVTPLLRTNNTASVSVSHLPVRLSWKDAAGAGHSYTFLDVTL